MAIVVPPSPLLRIVQREFVLEEDVLYRWRGRRLSIAAGFRTDGASIPRLVRPLFPPISEARAKASFPHDKLYGAHAFDDGPCARGEADRFMFDVCVAEGMPVLLALFIRWGLWAGGWWRWYGWHWTWLGPRKGPSWLR